MKHLFIINPKVRSRGFKPDDVVAEIHNFFAGNPTLEYDIHVTRWIRDAVGFVRKYVRNASDIIRVYAIGGDGTIFEVLNATAGMPNVQVAAYPAGLFNRIIKSFGREKEPYFKSIRTLAFSNASALGLIQFNNYYALGGVTMGFEAWVTHNFEEMIAKSFLSGKFHLGLCRLWSLLASAKNKISLNVKIDEKPVEGSFFSLSASTAAQGGCLDIYLLKRAPVHKMLAVLGAFARGDYLKHPKYIKHYTAQRLEVESNREFWLCGDGELYYEKKASLALHSFACDFVVPQTAEDLPASTVVHQC